MISVCLTASDPSSYSNWYKFTSIAMQLIYIIEVGYGMFDTKNGVCSNDGSFTGSLKIFSLHYWQKFVWDVF